MSPTVYSEADIAAKLELATVIDAVEAAVSAEARGLAQNIEKTMGVWDPASSAHALGATDSEIGLVVFKSWVNTPNGAAAVITAFDRNDGHLVAVIEAGTLGALRTAATTGVATRWLAAPDADTLVVIGTGRQAFRQVEAVALARTLREVRVFGRDPDRRAALVGRVTDDLGIPAVAARSVDAAVDGASIVTLVTRAREPFLRPDALAPRSHVNAVGAILPTNAEFDPMLLAHVQLTVVDNLANAKRASRELREHFRDNWQAVHTLGEVVEAKVARDQDDARPTLFKSLGMGLADLAAATAFLRIVEPGRFEAA